MSRLPSFAVVALLALPLAARATDIFVPGDHATVQAAIEASVDGDTIHIAAGTWPGALNTLDRNITLKGAGAELTIIDGLGAAQVLIGGSGSPPLTVMDLTLTGGVIGATSAGDFGRVVLYRCTVRNVSGVGATGAIEALDTSFLDNGGTGLAGFSRAERCIFKGNGGWGAENITSGFTTVITGCRFFGNGLGGLRMATTGNEVLPAQLTVERCVFAGDNLQLSTFETGGVGESIIFKCSFDGAIVKLMQGAASLDHCIVRGSTLTDFSPQGGFQVRWSDIEGGWPGLNNFDADPLWTDPANDDYMPLPGSPCINAGDPALPVDADSSISDIGGVPFHPWKTFGSEVAQLSGMGPLAAGEELTLQLLYGPASTPAWLVLGFDQVGAPFKGGTLWPQPAIVVGPLLISQWGFVLLSGVWPSGLPTGFSFWSQYWWQEPGTPERWGSSNGLRGDQP